MRAPLAATLVTAGLIASAPAAADEALPAGAIGPLIGAVSGTGADAKRLGFGYYQFGLQASWQPMTTGRVWGWTMRWSTMFGTLYTGSAAQIESTLHTVQMDLMVGVRFRPWRTPHRYLTVRGGGQLLRINEPIPPTMSRAFAGGIASVGLDQYVGALLFNVDVRYGLIGGGGPTQLALLLGVGFAGP
jgi:hypothetical protein